MIESWSRHMENNQLIKLKLTNNVGNLNRVVGVLSRIGSKITSMSCYSEPNDEHCVVNFSADIAPADRRLVYYQMKNLQDVLSVEMVESGDSLVRESVLVRIPISFATDKALQDVMDTYRTHVVHRSGESLILEVVGRPEKIEGFLDAVKEFNPLEVQRGGALTMHRERKDV